jgi:hypothetical protein
VGLIQVVIIALPMGNDDLPVHKSLFPCEYGLKTLNTYYQTAVTVGTSEKLQILEVHDRRGFAVPGNYLITVSTCSDLCRMQSESH